MRDFLLIFLGGGLGSVLRYEIGRLLNNTTFPYGTLLVNVLGSFIIGLFFVIYERHIPNHYMYTLGMVGFCGGFTTFSAFALEKFHMLREGHFMHFFMYILMSITLSLMAIFVVYKLGKVFIKVD